MCGPLPVSTSISGGMNALRLGFLVVWTTGVMGRGGNSSLKFPVTGPGGQERGKCRVEYSECVICGRIKYISSKYYKILKLIPDLFFF